LFCKSIFDISTRNSIVPMDVLYSSGRILDGEHQHLPSWHVSEILLHDGGHNWLRRRLREAYAFVYALEGTIVEGVRGGKEVTLTPGQTFYEGPNDVHTVGRNASTTRPAKFIVVLVKKKGVDLVLPAE
jgi:Cupin domain